MQKAKKISGDAELGSNTASLDIFLRNGICIYGVKNIGKWRTNSGNVVS